MLSFIIVDYDHNSFSISQAQYNEGTPSHIVATTSTNGTDTTNGNNSSTTNTSDNPSLVKSTSSTSHGMGTGAKAGIAAGIIVLAVVVAGFCFWKYRHRKPKPAQNTKNRAELEDNEEPKGIQEAYSKRRLSEESVRESKKGYSSRVNEIPQTPPENAAELDTTPFGGPSRAQTGLDQPERAELPSPDPFMPEMESSGLGFIRSELSTPEPRSELATADPSLVPELTSQDMRHELSGSNSNRNSRVRPLSYRSNSVNSEILPQDSASVRPTLHNRKGSDDSIPTPISPVPQRPSLRNNRRHSGFQRSYHGRLNSQSSHDTFETRFNPNSSTPQPQQQGSPSPLASPPLASQPSPSLSALNSPTLPHQQLSFSSGPPTPSLDISERDPLISSSQQNPVFRTKFSENLTSDPEVMTKEEKQRRDEARRVVVKEEVEKLEKMERNEGK